MGKTIYNSANFGGHRHSGSGDINILNFHVIWQYHGIKRSRESMGGSS